MADGKSFAPPLRASNVGLSEDLGWDDMGHDQHEAEIVPIQPDLAPDFAHHANGGKPAVVRQREAAARRTAAQRRSALADGRRAAFTLRVDAERHLALRLACTVNGRSAQQLVTDALDRLLAEQPEIAALASQVAKRRT
jgi:mRNA-degrading endonuclease toxin of MazEF toxin-antitoxin module